MMSAVLGRSDETPTRDASGTVIGRVTATLAQLTMSLTSAGARAGLCTSPVTSVHHSTATSELTEPSFEVCFNRPAAASPSLRPAEPRPAPAEPVSGHLLPPSGHLPHRKLPSRTWYVSW